MLIDAICLLSSYRPVVILNNTRTTTTPGLETVREVRGQSLKKDLS